MIGQRGVCQVLLVQTGIGLENAASVYQRVLAKEPLDLAISSGFAGALTDGQVGSLLIADSVTMHGTGPDLLRIESPVSCDTALIAQALRVAQTIGIEAQVGQMVSVQRVVVCAQEKRHLRDVTGAIGLDMESAALGTVAHACHVPFLVIRTVSDRVDEDLPIDFNLFFEPRGWIRGLCTVVARPSCWLGLVHMRNHTALASWQITRFFEEFLSLEHMETAAPNDTVRM